jgi:hypothetical protein
LEKSFGYDSSVGLRLFVLTSFSILTLVCVEAAGAPHGDAPRPEDIEAEAPAGETESPLILDNTSITVPPTRSRFEEYMQKFNRRDYYHSFRQSIYVHLGAIVALENSTDYDHLMALSSGFMWQPRKQFSPKWEVGAAWSMMGVGQIVGMRKHIYNEKAAFRPFYKYGVTLKIDPDEQSANVSDFENYMLRAGVGLESILKPPRSVRLDLDVALGQDDLWILFQYGYAWGL